MKDFMDKDFLLKNETAKELYHRYAKSMPICDYHCHLSVKEIAEDKRYKNITEVWLAGDHYKWRAMRSNGVEEKFITGSATDKEKFMTYAKTIPYTLGNPLYHWTHLELKRYFNIETLLSEKTAEEIWTICNQRIQEKEFTARGLITQSGVNVICTTDDPIDDLADHMSIQKDSTFKTEVLPTFRPDKAYNIHQATFLPWIKSLGEVVGYPIQSVEKLIQALIERIECFHKVGCRISDHGLDLLEYRSPNIEEAEKAFQKGLEGNSLTYDEMAVYKGTILHALGKAYASKGWVMQLHLGALRSNNQRMLEEIGPDTGFDSIHDVSFAKELSSFLDNLEVEKALPRTIIYVMNPSDNYVVGTMIGNFQGDSIPGKIQFGSGWWFCDQKDGMIQQMTALANLGLLSRFVGMLTDSRSFLSYTRHDYFRRILCNLIGEWVEEGEYPKDIEFLGQVVEDISYNNIMNYLFVKEKKGN